TIGPFMPVPPLAVDRSGKRPGYVRAKSLRPPSRGRKEPTAGWLLGGGSPSATRKRLCFRRQHDERQDRGPGRAGHRVVALLEGPARAEAFGGRGRGCPPIPRGDRVAHRGTSGLRWGDPTDGDDDMAGMTIAAVLGLLGAAGEGPGEPAFRAPQATSDYAA